LAVFGAENGSGPFQYVLADPYGNHVYYFPALQDSRGCRREYRDLQIQRRLEAEDGRSLLPGEFFLSVVPNPFNPSTTISFDLPHTQPVKLVVYDLLGREVAVLADKPFDAGSHQLTFDGSALPSGLYFAHIQTDEFTATQKLLLLK